MANNASKSKFDCLNFGSIVRCTTCFKDIFEGQVLAFDINTRLLVLSCQNNDAAQERPFTQIVNLNLCSDMELLKEVNGPKRRSQPSKLNFDRLDKVCERVKQKRTFELLVENPKATDLAKALFRTIGRQYKLSDVVWQNVDIIVLNEARISEPYNSVNVTVGGDGPEKLCVYLRKVVERFHTLNNSQPNC